MWKATSAGNTVYLLGSIHIGNDDFYPLAPEIDAAFAESKNLVVEVNVDDPDMTAKMTKLVAEKGRYKEGDTLTSKVSKKNADAFKAYCEKKGYPFDQMNMLRPWLFSLTITLLEAQALGFKAELGIDKHFLALAKDKMPIKELESAETQIGMLSGFSDELQETLLAKSLGDVDSMNEKMTSAIKAWKTGNTKALEDLMVTDELKKHPEFLPMIEKIIYERNVGMADKIDGYLKSNEKHFVVVGAGHLVGEKGLVNLLIKKGYKVEQVSRTK